MNVRRHMKTWALGTKLATICVVTLVASGCISIPTARPLTDLERRSLGNTRSGPMTVAIRGCEPEPADRRIPSCEYRIHEVSGLLSETGLFSSVRVGSQVRGDEDVLVQVSSYEERPYYESPGHNPGFFVVSIVIPFWWSEPFGYRFSVERKRDGKLIEVDTTRTGTVLMWGLAWVFNLSDTRSLVQNRKLEIDHVKLQLEKGLAAK